MKKTLLMSASLLCFAGGGYANASSDGLPTREEMWAVIQMQQKQIKELQARSKQQDQKIVHTTAKVKETADKVEKTVQAVEETKETVASIEPSSGSILGDKTSIGGYGELHYNGGNKDEIDFHRFVVNLNHDFTDDVRLQSEIEIEHTLSGEGKAGEVTLEQAFIEFDLTEDDAHRAKAGIFLIPVGILNEKHEPPTFFGVERNPIETNIIPTTFREAGIAFNGNLGESGFGYDAAVHSALSVPTTGDSAFKIRSGRNKVAEAEATDPAFTGRLKWTGYPGVEIGAAAQYQPDVTQDANDDESVEATLLETHADLRRGGWGLRALYARWDLDSNAAEALGADEQHGFYIEPSYRFEVPFGFDDGYGEAGIFTRYNQWDTNAGSNAVEGEFEQIDIGVNYWPIPDVVLKADFAFIDAADSDDDDERLNLGIGYQF